MNDTHFMVGARLCEPQQRPHSPPGLESSSRELSRRGSPCSKYRDTSCLNLDLVGSHLVSASNNCLRQRRFRARWNARTLLRLTEPRSDR
jgi:hypothetical protein